MNFIVVEGRDIYALEEDFAELYNSNTKVEDIIKELDLSMSQYTKLRKHCAEKGVITVKGTKPHKPKGRKPAKCYHRNGFRFTVKRKGVFYASAKTEKEAQLLVERFEKCGWDKSQSTTIINEVKKIVGR